MRLWDIIKKIPGIVLGVIIIIMLVIVGLFVEEIMSYVTWEIWAIPIIAIILLRLYDAYKLEAEEEKLSQTVRPDFWICSDCGERIPYSFLKGDGDGFRRCSGTGEHYHALGSLLVEGERRMQTRLRALMLAVYGSFIFTDFY